MQAPLDGQPRVPVDDGRQAAGGAYVAVNVDAGVPFVREHGVETVPAPGLPACGGDPAPVQVVGYVDDLPAGQEAVVYFLHQGRPVGIQLQGVVLRPPIAEGDRAGDHTVFRIVGQAPLDVHGHLGAAEFCVALQHGLQKDTFRAGGNVFLAEQAAHAALLQLRLVDGGVVPVPGEAVILPGKDEGPAAGLCVPQHAVEFRAAVRAAGHVPVGIAGHDIDIIPGGVGHAVLHLLFDGHVALAVGAVPGINHPEGGGLHGVDHVHGGVEVGGADRHGNHALLHGVTLRGTGRSSASRRRRRRLRPQRCRRG